MPRQNSIPAFGHEIHAMSGSHPIDSRHFKIVSRREFYPGKKDKVAVDLGFKRGENDADICHMARIVIPHRLYVTRLSRSRQKGLPRLISGTVFAFYIDARILDFRFCAG